MSDPVAPAPVRPHITVKLARVLNPLDPDAELVQCVVVGWSDRPGTAAGADDRDVVVWEPSWGEFFRDFHAQRFPPPPRLLPPAPPPA